jgi:hypothetical protein
MLHCITELLRGIEQMSVIEAFCRFAAPSASWSDHDVVLALRARFMVLLGLASEPELQARR